MKKTILIALICTLCLQMFAACGNDKGADSTTAAVTDGAAAQTTAASVVTTEKPTETAAPQDDPETPTGFEDTELPADGVIKTAAELGKVLTDGDPNSSYTVEAEELDMSAIRYSSLGNGDTVFTGIIDFGGCTLKGLTAPLIGYSIGGTITNLKIADTKIEHTYEMADGVAEWGLVVSNGSGITLSNIEIADSVELAVSIWQDNACVGGVVGYASDNSTFTNISSAATMSTDSMKIFVSPIIAKFEGSSNETCVVKNCVFTGTLTAIEEGCDSKVAGIVGAASNVTITGCANYGTIDSKDGGQNAGILGWPCGDGYIVEYCINAGTVTGGSYTGGIVGYSNRAGGVVRNCINVAAVSNESAGQCGAIGGLLKNSEIWSDCFWVTGNSEVGYNDAGGNATVTNYKACESIEAAVAAANEASEGSFQVVDGKVVFGD